MYVATFEGPGRGTSEERGTAVAGDRLALQQKVVSRTSGARFVAPKLKTLASDCPRKGGNFTSPSPEPPVRAKAVACLGTTTVTTTAGFTAGATPANRQDPCRLGLLG